jgi:hypothetical protein
LGATCISVYFNQLSPHEVTLWEKLQLNLAQLPERQDKSREISLAIVSTKTAKLSAPFKSLLQDLQRHFNATSSSQLPGVQICQAGRCCLSAVASVWWRLLLLLLILLVVRCRYSAETASHSSQCACWIGGCRCGQMCGMCWPFCNSNYLFSTLPTYGSILMGVG